VSRWHVARKIKSCCIHSKVSGNNPIPLSKVLAIQNFLLGPFFAMILPVDLIIMANDGTEGDKVLAYLKVPEQE